MQNALRNARDEFFRGIGCEDAAGRSKGITLRGGRGDDRGGYGFCETESCCGIDDMRVVNAVDLDALLQIT